LKKIILSRTDNLGDVVLTLPMAGVLKKYIPGCRIWFLGKSYTKPLIDCCEHIDGFIDAAQLSGGRETGAGMLKETGADIIIHVFPVKEICRLAKKAGIPVRIGTSHRWFTWLYCNKLIHRSRRNSDLHEAQLNLKMLEPLGIRQEFSREEIAGYYGMAPALTPSPSPSGEGMNGMRLILHPKSKGSAREWGLDNFSRLIEILPEDKYTIYITGTKEEGLQMKQFLETHRNRVTDMTGKLTLPELISFINSCDGLVAASTGPLHIAAALGKFTLGLYAPMKPIWPQRWAPIGKNASYLVHDKPGCNDCRNTNDCSCLRQISPEEVAERIRGNLS
jgi:heptosyltransferase III